MLLHWWLQRPNRTHILALLWSEGITCATTQEKDNAEAWTSSKTKKKRGKKKLPPGFTKSSKPLMTGIKEKCSFNGWLFKTKEQWIDMSQTLGSMIIHSLEIRYWRDTCKTCLFYERQLLAGVQAFRHPYCQSLLFSLWWSHVLSWNISCCTLLKTFKPHYSRSYLSCPFYNGFLALLAHTHDLISTMAHFLLISALATLLQQNNLCWISEMC